MADGRPASQAILPRREGGHLVWTVTQAGRCPKTGNPPDRAGPAGPTSAAGVSAPAAGGDRTHVGLLEASAADGAASEQQLLQIGAPLFKPRAQLAASSTCAGVARSGAAR